MDRKWTAHGPSVKEASSVHQNLEKTCSFCCHMFADNLATFTKNMRRVCLTDIHVWATKCRLVETKRRNNTLISKFQYKTLEISQSNLR